MQGRAVPLVDMQIRRHVSGQTRRGRRSAHGLDGEVVHASLSHAHVPEVEVLGAQRVCSKQRLRGGQVASVTPRAWQLCRRVHGGQWRRHLHGGECLCVYRCVVWRAVRGGRTRVRRRLQRAWAGGGGAAGSLSAYWARGTVIGLTAGGEPISI